MKNEDAQDKRTQSIRANQRTKIEASFFSILDKGLLKEEKKKLELRIQELIDQNAACEKDISRLKEEQEELKKNQANNIVINNNVNINNSSNDEQIQLRDKQIKELQTTNKDLLSKIEVFKNKFEEASKSLENLKREKETLERTIKEKSGSSF